jgi:hypothetical protein
VVWKGGQCSERQTESRADEDVLLENVACLFELEHVFLPAMCVTYGLFFSPVRSCKQVIEVAPIID